MFPTFNLEVHFYQQDEVAVFLESTLSGKKERLSLIHVFVLFALRQMSNLGVHPITDSLAQMLARARLDIEMLASGFEAGGVRLIRYPGTPGRRQFLVQARIFADGSATLDMKSKGFGLLGTGVGYYAPTSVLAFLRFLAQRWCDSPSDLKSLAEAAVACGTAYCNGEISLTNQGTLAMRIMESIDFDAHTADQNVLTPDEAFFTLVDAPDSYYVLETNAGVLMLDLPAPFGESLPIWDKQEPAEEACRECPEYRVSGKGCLSFQEIVTELEHGGVGYVCIDWGPHPPDAKVVPMKVVLENVSSLCRSTEKAMAELLMHLGQLEGMTGHEYLRKLAANTRLLDEAVCLSRRLGRPP